MVITVLRAKDNSEDMIAIYCQAAGFLLALMDENMLMIHAMKPQ